MKKLLGWLLLFLFVGIVAEAQKLSSKEKKARDVYSEARWVSDPRERIKRLKEAVELDNQYIEAYWLMSSSYKEMGDDASTIYYLEKIARPEVKYFDKTVFRLGKEYYAIGEYEKAKAAFQKAEGKYPAWEKKCDVALDLKRHPIDFKPVNLTNVNTEFDDYWPSITADGKNILTTVYLGISEGKVSGQIQEDIYLSKLDKNGKWGKSVPIEPPLNTDQNEGAQNFSVDGRYMFFVACNRPSGLGDCDIYYSIKKGDRWSNPINPGTPLNTIFQETTPSFSAAGNELFFASSRPGGQGGDDIWVSKVKILDNGYLEFGVPENLPAEVNTAEAEISPFIHVDNHTLYFSSKGHPGMGGFDIFYSKRDDKGKWSIAKNLGYPINTHRDEIGFCVNAQGDKAYLSSNGIQKNSRGKDIYEIVLPEDLRPKKMDFFDGKVVDPETKKPLQARVEVFQLADNQIVFQSISDEETGEFTAYLPTDKEYGYNVSKKNYMFYSGELLQQDSLKTPKVINLHTIAVGEKVILKNVFFDFDKSTLKPESKGELQRVADFLTKNPKVSVELGGHTDAKGSGEYNQKLSESRAKVVVDYLISLGIDADRMSYKGYGKDRPIADNNTDVGRALNRRTEIIITKK